MPQHSAHPQRWENPSSLQLLAPHPISPGCLGNPWVLLEPCVPPDPTQQKHLGSCTPHHHGTPQDGAGPDTTGSCPAELHSVKLQKPTPKIFTSFRPHAPAQDLKTTGSGDKSLLCALMVPLPLSLLLSLMCQGTLHHLTATSESPGPPQAASDLQESPAVAIGGPHHCPHPSPTRGHAPALTAWSLQDGTSFTGVVWPQGQPLCHLRQGWTTPTHPGLSEPTEEVPLPLCHPRSQHRLGPTHPITRRAGKPKAPAAPAAPTSPGRGPARREGRGTPGTAGARPVRSVSRPRCARSCRALPGVLYRLRRKTTRGSSGQALFRGAAPDPNSEVLPSPSLWLPW